VSGSLFHTGKLTNLKFSLTEEPRRASEHFYAKGREIPCQKKAKGLREWRDLGWQRAGSSAVKRDWV